MIIIVKEQDRTKLVVFATYNKELAEWYLNYVESTNKNSNETYHLVNVHDTEFEEVTESELQNRTGDYLCSKLCVKESLKQIACLVQTGESSHNKLHLSIVTIPVANYAMQIPCSVKLIANHSIILNFAKYIKEHCKCYEHLGLHHEAFDTIIVEHAKHFCEEMGDSIDTSKVYLKQPVRLGRCK